MTREQAIVALIKKGCKYCRRGWPIQPDSETDGVKREMRYHTLECQYTPGVFGGGFVECEVADLRLALRCDA